MRYLVWTLIALVGYTFVPPLMNLATREVPSTVATFAAASMLAGTALALSLWGREPIVGSLAGAHGWYVLAAGGFLTVSILSFFRALSLGPVSIVAPIFGLFLVTSSVIGVAVLDEPMTIQRAMGVLLAMLAIALLSLE
ncbi:EamA family transporter [Natrinema longum]|uniref:EamA family transporter n=1 Tax=Natrinema longum TaxID=370324 RepID=UPI001CD008BB|nr:EamA family transporter [Natrinema longum]MBZ6496781.1 EamA family transporter [Natrinema longum]